MRPPKSIEMTEAELDSLVRGQPNRPGYARLCGWLVYHTFNSSKSDPGFPDLVLVRDGRIVYAELKTEKGRLTKHQRDWLKALDDAGQEVYVWRPSDWDHGRIQEVLK